LQFRYRGSRRESAVAQLSTLGDYITRKFQTHKTMTVLIEELANQIVLAMGGMADSAKVEGVSEGDELSVLVSIDAEAFSKKLAVLIQEACNKHNFDHQDSIALATLCFHRVMEIPMDEAKELADESIS
jgi:hypothetical protein